MKYICEICNKTYDSEHKAIDCERKHEEAKAKKKQRAEQMAAAEKAITEAVNAFIAKYKQAPNMSLTPENQKVLSRDIERKWDETIDELLRLLA